MRNTVCKNLRRFAKKYASENRVKPTEINNKGQLYCTGWRRVYKELKRVHAGKGEVQI